MLANNSKHKIKRFWKLLVRHKVEQQYEPYQRVGFLSDIYKGAPSSQMAISQQSGGGVSPAQSILGLGVAGLSAAAGAAKAGLF
jgi:hypothetical protein